MLTRVVDTACGPVEYSEDGVGDPILYFHGTGVTGDAMLAIEAPLVDDGFRLIVPNRPGYGDTPLASGRSTADCANLAAALLDMLCLAAVHVMGSSGGAGFALKFALRHARRTRSLVLLCPQLHRWDDRRWLPATSKWTLPLLKRPLLRRSLLALYRLHLPRMSVRQFLKTEAGDRYNDVDSDAPTLSLCETTLAAMAAGTKCAGFDNDFAVFVNEDVLHDDDSLNCPALIIHDMADPMAPVEHVHWFASHVPDCERVSLRTAGHLIWVGPEASVMHRTRVRFLQRLAIAAR